MKTKVHIINYVLNIAMMSYYMYMCMQVLTIACVVYIIILYICLHVSMVYFGLVIFVYTLSHSQAELFARFRNQAAAALGGGGGGPSPSMGDPVKQVSDEELADANQRNRAISSSAISRAMSDANAGKCIMDVAMCS